MVKIGFRAAGPITVVLLISTKGLYDLVDLGIGAGDQERKHLLVLGKQCNCYTFDAGLQDVSRHNAILFVFQEVQVSELKVSPWPRRLQS